MSEMKVICDKHGCARLLYSNRLRCPVCRAETNRRYSQSEKGRIKSQARSYDRDAYLKRRTTKAYRSTCKAYLSTLSGQAVRRAASNRYQKLHPEVNRAHQAVYRAVKSGKLVKPSSCGRCLRKSRRIQAHHHSYKKEHQLNVLDVPAMSQERARWVRKAIVSLADVYQDPLFLDLVRRHETAVRRLREDVARLRAHSLSHEKVPTDPGGKWHAAKLQEAAHHQIDAVRDAAADLLRYAFELVPHSNDPELLADLAALRSAHKQRLAQRTGWGQAPLQLRGPEEKIHVDGGPPLTIVLKQDPPKA